MIFAVLSLFLVAGSAADNAADSTAEEAPSERMELAQLCADYDALSDRLAEEYIATRSGATEDMIEGSGQDLSAEERDARRKAFYEQVESQVRYNQTRKELRAVVEALGTRECPSQDYGDFEPLIDDA